MSKRSGKSQSHWRNGLVVSLCVVLALSAPLSAQGDVADDGLWYFDALRIEEHHAAGWTGKGVTIAVYDGPVNLEVPTLHGADVRVQEQNYCKSEETGEFYSPTSLDVTEAAHGTNVLSYIVGSGAGYPGQQGVKGIAPEATVLYWAGGFGQWEDCAVDPIYEFRNEPGGLIDRVIESGADILSVSGTISVSPTQVAQLLRAGVMIIGAGTNERFGLSAFPAGSNGAVGVQNADSSGFLVDHGERADYETDVVAPGIDVLWQGVGNDWQQQGLAHGSSQAAPMVAAILALVKQKYPHATNNQILQSLIRNASNAVDHAPVFDETGQLGYGMVSATRMLEADPTSYPDVNPFILKETDPRLGYELRPTYDEIVNPAPQEDLIVTPPPEDRPAADLGGALLWAAIIGVGILVLALVALIIVLTVRRNGRSSDRK